jgi:hypothetical protein
MSNATHKIWAGWKKFALAFAGIQAEIILFLFYFLIFTPYGFLLKVFRFDPLKLRLKNGTSWRDVKIGRYDKEKARRQS